jgi:hypothetical protein
MQNAKCKNAPRSGAFLLGKIFVRKILISARNIEALRKKAAVKSSSLNLNVAHQNFEVKIFLNPRRQNAHLFAGSHAVQLHISCVLLLRPLVH